MKTALWIILILAADSCQGLFVPEQLTTLLSFLYTNIPPVRKGTDSRVGLGFRLGPNADFQVLLELGPQQATQPIGPDGGTNKREIAHPVAKPNDWLHAWKLQEDGATVGAHQGYYQNVPRLDQDVVDHLKQLYKEQPKVHMAKRPQEEESQEATTAEPETLER